MIRRKRRKPDYVAIERMERELGIYEGTPYVSCVRCPTTSSPDVSSYLSTAISNLMFGTPETPPMEEL